MNSTRGQGTDEKPIPFLSVPKTKGNFMCCGFITMGSLVLGSATTLALFRYIRKFHMEIESTAIDVDLTLSSNVEDKGATPPYHWQNLSLVLSHKKTRAARGSWSNRAKKSNPLPGMAFFVSSASLFGGDALIQLML